MTIINPTQIIDPVTPPRLAGDDQDAQLRRLRALAAEVSRRFYAHRDTTAALAYVLIGDDLDVEEHADPAAYLVADVLAFIADLLESTDLDAWTLDGTESKQFRKGYRAALDQVGTEILEAMKFRI